MKISGQVAMASHILFVFLVPLAAASSSSLTTFLQCLKTHTNPAFISDIYKQENSSFLPNLQYYERNKRFNFSSSSTLKPLALIAAANIADVQTTVACCKTSGLLLKTRSGGHDFDGLSYVANVPYIILDLFNLRRIDIDLKTETAWVESGATLGEVYYKVNKASNVKGFPAGVCPTVAAGGHFSGGGYGNMLRKYGLSADNVVDAKIINVNGQILDRKAMGEDLFWAIRGGGGPSFGVVLSYKIKLVTVPAKVTVFSVARTMEQGAADVLYKWQTIAPKLPNELFIRAVITVVNGTKAGEKTVRVNNIAMFLGDSESLLALMNKSFPQLGLKKSDCIEMSWLESILYWSEFPNGTPTEAILNRTDSSKFLYKIRSDYVYEPIPLSDLEIIFKKLIEVEQIFLYWNPYGGRMSEIGVSETPFPHRGALFKIQHLIQWISDRGTKPGLEISRKFYEFMAPYVSKNPRQAYLCYRDIDIGSSLYSNATLEEAKVYGEKYFMGNFDRLVKVKTEVDPSNFFRNEQSIPPIA